jgi:hypothetical protein
MEATRVLHKSVIKDIIVKGVREWLDVDKTKSPKGYEVPSITDATVIHVEGETPKGAFAIDVKAVYRIQGFQMSDDVDSASVELRANAIVDNFVAIQKETGEGMNSFSIDFNMKVDEETGEKVLVVQAYTFCFPVDVMRATGLEPYTWNTQTMAAC